MVHMIEKMNAAYIHLIAEDAIALACEENVPASITKYHLISFGAVHS